MENKSNGQAMDLQKVCVQWLEMQSERDKERKLMSKLINELKRDVATAGNTTRLDSLFKYMSEQMELLRQYSLNQA